jgi:hypothetical protein
VVIPPVPTAPAKLIEPPVSDEPPAAAAPPVPLAGVLLVPLQAMTEKTAPAKVRLAIPKFGDLMVMLPSGSA